MNMVLFGTISNKRYARQNYFDSGNVLFVCCHSNETVNGFISLSILSNDTITGKRRLINANIS